MKTMRTAQLVTCDHCGKPRDTRKTVTLSVELTGTLDTLATRILCLKCWHEANYGGVTGLLIKK